MGEALATYGQNAPDAMAASMCRESHTSKVRAIRLLQCSMRRRTEKKTSGLTQLQTDDRQGPESRTSVREDTNVTSRELLQKLNGNLCATVVGIMISYLSKRVRGICCDIFRGGFRCGVRCGVCVWQSSAVFLLHSPLFLMIIRCETVTNRVDHRICLVLLFGLHHISRDTTRDH